MFAYCLFVGVLLLSLSIIMGDDDKEFIHRRLLLVSGILVAIGLVSSATMGLIPISATIPVVVAAILIYGALHQLDKRCRAEKAWVQEQRQITEPPASVSVRKDSTNG